MPNWPRMLYNLVLLIASPVLLTWFFCFRRGREGIGRRWPEFFGFGAPAPAECRWIHAASVGEVLAIMPLLQRLLKTYPDQPLLVTTTTITGAERLQAVFGDQVHHRFAPLDFPGTTRRFIRRHHPKQCVLVEREWWPNWLAACRHAKVPVMLINARLSGASCEFYQRFPRLTRDMMQSLDYVLAQTKEDAARLERLGVPRSRLSVTGNIKFSAKVSRRQREAGEALRRQFGDRPVWVAASTHDDEEVRLLAAHQQLLTHLPDALLILVPRHPQRFNQVHDYIENTGLNSCRRSQQHLPTSAEAVYLSDTMGEMMILMGACDIAFVGGSLIDHGGHNLLEPAVLAKPILTGRSVFNFQQVCDELLKVGGCRIVNDDNLADTLLHWFTHPDEAQQAGLAAQQVVNARQGSLNKVIERLQ